MRTSLFHRAQPRRSIRGERALTRLRRGPIRAADPSGAAEDAPAADAAPAAEDAPAAEATGTAKELGKAGLGEQSPAAISQATGAVGADAAVGRVQAAGGPLDQATYACSCGLLFSAPVSTTVCCPHCGAEQAW